MDCGVPFCHQGCPLGNLIPEWNDLIWRDKGEEAMERLHATNNFPEFTGRLCPAPCEASCVLGINQPAVTIKQVEVSIVDQAFENGWVNPLPPARLTGKTVAVVGSGPAGLAVAQQLTRVGHTVAVYERDDKIGGLLRYGIPDFKMEKEQVDRRLEQMKAEGTRFRTGVAVGTDVTWEQLRRRYDAVVIATGATVPRDLPIPGRELEGVHFAMDYLVPANRVVAGETVENQINAAGKHVVILGGGDTGADCLGTAHRHQAASVTTLAIGKQPPVERAGHQPWPTFPTLFEVASAHEEGGERTYLASTVEFVGENGKLTGVKVAETEFVDGKRLPEGRHRADHPRGPRLPVPRLHRRRAGRHHRAGQRRLRRPRQRGPRRLLHDQHRRHLRRRRRRPRTVAHRLGHRRGARLRRRGGQVPDGQHHPAGTRGADRPCDGRSVVRSHWFFRSSGIHTRFNFIHATDH